MIELKNVSMSYPEQRRLRDYFLHPFRRTKKCTALQEINGVFNHGDRIAILGPNGAGKTTLLKLIGGLLLPTHGRVVVNGFDTQSNNLEVRASVGYAMNEDRSFYWQLSGRQNIEFFGMLDNLYGTQLKKRIDTLIDNTSLSRFQHKPVKTYSSGMKQKLALVRGLISDSTIVILDEPTKTLDPRASEEMIVLIKKIIQTNPIKTLLISTHALSIVQTLCTKVCIINHGRIVSFETLEDVLAKYSTLTQYYKNFG